MSDVPYNLPYDSKVARLKKRYQGLARVTAAINDLYIYGDQNLKKGAAIINHENDHRILMAFYIANLICKKNNIIKDKSCVKTSYPKFFQDISRLSN